MNVAGNPFELRKVGLVESAAYAERSHSAAQAAARTATRQIRRCGSYHGPARSNGDRLLRPPVMAAAQGSIEVSYLNCLTVGRLIQIKSVCDPELHVAGDPLIRILSESKLL
jgi:hypothetical protein